MCAAYYFFFVTLQDKPVGDRHILTMPNLEVNEYDVSDGNNLVWDCVFKDAATNFIPTMLKEQTSIVYCRTIY